MPELPEEKRRSIERLDMSSLEKVILQFDKVFWGAFEGQAGMFADHTAPGKFPFFVDMTGFTDKPTIVCLYGGRFSRQIQETWSNEKIVSESLQILSRILQAPVPEPIATRVTRWHKNPWSYGSYSYLPVGSSLDDLDTLAEPVMNRVLFAGGATHRDYFATVHGAVLSGIREAERLGGRADVLPGW